MIRDPDNFYQRIHQYYPADRFDDYLDNSGVSSETIALVKKLSFPYGKTGLFLRHTDCPGYAGDNRGKNPVAEDPVQKIDSPDAASHHA